MNKKKKDRPNKYSAIEEGHNIHFLKAFSAHVSWPKSSVILFSLLLIFFFLLVDGQLFDMCVCSFFC